MSTPESRKIEFLREKFFELLQALEIVDDDDRSLAIYSLKYDLGDQCEVKECKRIIAPGTQYCIEHKNL